MALQVTSLKREFVFGKKTLTDPNNNMTPEEVKKHYSGSFPELTNATLSGPRVEGDKAIYSFKATVGTKG